MTNDLKVIEAFGNKLRIRVCGILMQEDRILLVKHRSMGEDGTFWAPPGGGLKYGETILDCLHREFLEETGLQIADQEFIGLNEFMHLPLHAMELFFYIKSYSGNLMKGQDPEIVEEDQIITEVRYLDFNELSLIPSGKKHEILVNINNLKELFQLKHRFIE